VDFYLIRLWNKYHARGIWLVGLENAMTGDMEEAGMRQII
jgi:hypothetical protein